MLKATEYDNILTNNAINTLSDSYIIQEILSALINLQEKCLKQKRIKTLYQIEFLSKLTNKLIDRHEDVMGKIII